jgi:carbamoyl-phosphate synthase small subunit
LTNSALLALEDGTLFYGKSIGAEGHTVGEVVFNTAITGYQEILTDPSYCQQIVTLTQPHIGNVGVNPEDEESSAVHASGLVIRDLPITSSNWRSEQPLSDYLVQNKTIAIADIDTRRLTRILRDKGAQNGCLMAGPELDPERAIAEAKKFPGLKGADLAREVTVENSYHWSQGTWSLEHGLVKQEQNTAKTWKVVAYDFGVKRNILRILSDMDCDLTVVPAMTPAEEVLSTNPNGVFLSNGPGDPDPCDYAIKAIKNILDAGLPVFGICLGYQLLSFASGAKTIKMKFGHHGANHPVVDLDTRHVLITSQNHGFAVDEESLPNTMDATHRSLFDGTLQGVHHNDLPAFGFQGHPEASPGPHDVQPLFEHFIQLMKDHA